MDQEIVHVLTTVHHGGAERIVLELARHQRRLGARPRVICLHQLGALHPVFEAAGIPVTLLNGSDRPGVLRTAWHLAAALRTINPAVVHTHNAAPQIAAGFGQRLRHWRQPGTALVHTEHGRLPDLRATRLQLRRWTAAEFGALLAVSADAQAQLLAHGIRGANGVDVVSNGVDTTHFVPRRVQRGEPTARVVHVGRLDQLKGQDVLLAAMPMVRRDIPKVKLTVVGDGPTRGRLETQARHLAIDDLVQFVGAVADVRPFLNDADLFVLPSRSEGISLALLEAMATGLPCVATDVGGNREVIASERCGQLVLPEQPDRLAAAIVAALSHPDRSAAQGAAARREVEERFAFERTVAAYTECYARAGAAGAVRAMGSAA